MNEIIYKIPQYQKADIGGIVLTMDVDRLDDGDVLGKWFFYRMIKNIEIRNNGSLLFQTNGMIIQSTIALEYPQHKQLIVKGYVSSEQVLRQYCRQPTTFYIPIGLKTTIPTNTIHPTIITIETIPHNKVSVSVLTTECPKTANSFVIETTNRIMEVVSIDKGHTIASHTIDHNFMNENLVFYVDDGIVLGKIETKYEPKEGCQLNIYSTYNRYFCEAVPMNYTFPFRSLDGIDFTKIEQITFYFDCNSGTGGNIYLISKQINTWIYNDEKLTTDFCAENDNIIIYI